MTNVTTTATTATTANSQELTPMQLLLVDLEVAKQNLDFFDKKLGIAKQNSSDNETIFNICVELEVWKQRKDAAMLSIAALKSTNEVGDIVTDKDGSILVDTKCFKKHLFYKDRMIAVYSGCVLLKSGKTSKRTRTIYQNQILTK